MTGVLQGGWEFVGAAYAVSAVVLFGYCATLIWRLRAARTRSARQSSEVPS
jgi:hypothetical protein